MKDENVGQDPVETSSQLRKQRQRGSVTPTSTPCDASTATALGAVSMAPLTQTNHVQLQGG